MDSNAAGAKLDTIKDQVVAFGANLPGCGFELVEIFIDDAGEGMLGADPGFVRFAPFKEWKTGEP